MSREAVERVASALLYEGYLLYPYRPSAVKNRTGRFNFGVLYPGAYSAAQDGVDPCVMRTECLVLGREARVEVRVRFLQLVTRTVARLTPEGQERPVERLEVDGRIYAPWQEAVEREIVLPPRSLAELARAPHPEKFEWPGGDEAETLGNPADGPAAVIRRVRSPLIGEVQATARETAPGVYALAVEIENGTGWTAPDPKHPPSRDAVLPSCLISAHTILTVSAGEFVSLLDPPEPLREAVAGCRNIGTWPVLAGVPGSRSTMLSSPIIVYDYPEIAPESAGDLFDATENDELLSLRILTLTDAEKREASQLDERARLLLERTEALAEEQLARMHGTIRTLRPVPEER